MELSITELAIIIDHTLLKPETIPKYILRVFQEALTYNFASGWLRGLQSGGSVTGPREGCIPPRFSTVLFHPRASGGSYRSRTSGGNCL